MMVWMIFSLLAHSVVLNIFYNRVMHFFSHYHSPSCRPIHCVKSFFLTECFNIQHTSC